jgi:hypothetical protein
MLPLSKYEQNVKNFLKSIVLLRLHPRDGDELAATACQPHLGLATSLVGTRFREPGIDIMH